MSYESESDFTAEDRGRFSHPDTVGDHSYADLEALVFDALGKNYRTLPRIKDHARLERSFDLTPVIEGMQLDKKIRKVENGSFTAYFLHDQRPTRFWHNGDGTVGAEFPEPDAPHPFADKIGKPAVPVAHERPILDQKPYSKVPIEISPDELEDAMAEHGSVSAAAKELEVGYSTLYSKMNGQAALKQAADRGLRRYKAANPKPEKTPKQEKIMSTAAATARQTRNELSHAHSPKGIEWSVELFRDAHNRGETMTELAERLGVSYQSVYYQTEKHDDFKVAFFGNGVEVASTAKIENKPKPASIINKRNDELLTKIEEHAFNGLSVRKAAEAIGMTYWSLKDNVRGRIKDQSIKDAWERGLARRNNALKNLSDDIAVAESSETVTDRHDREIAETAGLQAVTSSEEPQRTSTPDPQEIQPHEPAAAETETTEAETATAITNDVDEEPAASGLPLPFEGPIERFGQISVDPFSERASDKPYHSIKIRNIKADLEKPDERPTFDRPSSIMKEIFDIQREAAAEFPQAPVSTRFLPFGKDGEIILGFEGNYFDLTKSERRFLDTIADRLDGYGKPTPRKRTKLQRFADWLANI